MLRAGFGILVSAVLIASVLAGCGGGGDGTSTTTSALTKVVFVSRGNEICEKADQRKSAALGRATGSKGLNLTRAEGEKLILEVVLPIYREQTKELAALGAPKGDSGAVAAVIAGFEKAIDASEAKPSLALEGKAFVSADEAAAKYGLVRCIL